MSNNLCAPFFCCRFLEQWKDELGKGNIHKRACEKTKSFFTRPFYFRESVAISVEIEHNPPYPIR